MKVYEADGCGGLVDVTANHRGLVGYTDKGKGVCIADRMEILVLVKSEEHGAWLTPAGERVDLYNTHGTGELRWHEPMGAHEEDFERLSPAALGAAQFFELLPVDMAKERWQEIQDGYLINLSDLSEVEVGMLREAAGAQRGICGVTRVNGEPSPPEYGAIYDMNRKGLVTVGGSSGHDKKHTQYYRITNRGRKVLKEGIG
jgi:hypothetical protein